MERKTVGALGALFAASALFRPAVTRTSAQESSGAPPRLLQTVVAAPYGCEIPETGPWEALAKLFPSPTSQTSVEQEKARKAAAATAVSSKWNFVPNGTPLTFLAVAVADPEQTHLALNFDRVIESVMWGAGDAGYIFERYWIPWSFGSAREGVTPAEEECREKVKQRRQQEPGLIVFRRKPVDNTLAQQFLLVWLVGEAPTFGLNRSQFANAIGYTHELLARIRGPEVKDASTTLRLVGPNFSGSLYPLTADLPGLLNRYPEIRISMVSGAVTNYEAIGQFKKSLPEVTFDTTIENDSRASELFFEYLVSQWKTVLKLDWLSSEVAILSEDETVYGDIGFVPRSDPHDWLTLRYPREIARLRNASAVESSEKAKQESPRQSGVPLSLSDAASGTSERPETIGTFSSQQSPASQQAVLLNISSTLRRERAAYAGIVATDVRDALFLTRFLRTANPDTRIFIFDSDLLFLREAETSPLIGTIAVTNYPLFSRNQHWTKTQREGQMPRRIQFSSRYAEAIYNACRFALSQLDRSAPIRNADQKTKVPPEIYLEYEHPFKERGDTPPLWLTVLGRDSYWPVALLDQVPVEKLADSTLKHIPQEHSANDPPEDLHPEPPSRSWLLLFWLALIFCALHVLYVGSLLRLRPKQRITRFVIKSLRKLFSAYPDLPPTPRERPFLLAATIALLSSLAVFSLPMARFQAFSWARWDFSIALVCLAGLAVLAVLLLFANTPYRFIVGMVCFLAVLFLTIWVCLIRRDTYQTGYFMAYRSLYLGNGVAPGLPIVILATAFYGWAWIHLKRESWAKDRREIREDQEKNRINECQIPELHELMAKTDYEIEDIMSHRIRIPALVFLGLWFLLLWPPRTLRSVEHYSYDILYTLILMTLNWCICLMCVQFYRTWTQFRTFLEAVERNPVRSAFSRLPKEISWIPLVSVVPARNLLVSSRTYDCLRSIQARLARCNPVSEPNLLADLQTVQSDIDPLVENLKSNLIINSNVDFDPYLQLQRSFDKAGCYVVQHLKRIAWQRGASESIRREEERRTLSPLTEEEKLLILEEEFVALRLLLYMRYVLRQLRNFLGFIVAGFIISIISLNSYPFQAHRWIGLSSIIALLLIGTVVAIVFAEMDRDAVLSRITDTKANEVGKTFFFRLAQFGALPLLTVLAAQFPMINRALFSWVQPALEALK